MSKRYVIEERAGIALIFDTYFPNRENHLRNQARCVKEIDIQWVKQESNTVVNRATRRKQLADLQKEVNILNNQNALSRNAAKKIISDYMKYGKKIKFLFLSPTIAYHIDNFHNCLKIS